MKKNFMTFLEMYSKLPGSVWVDVWSLVALVRFALGLPVDSVFLGVLGIFAGSKMVRVMKQPGDDDAAK